MQYSFLPRLEHELVLFRPITPADLTRVPARVLESNARSKAVFERCGFRRAGLLAAHRKQRGMHGKFDVHAHVIPHTAS